MESSEQNLKTWNTLTEKPSDVDVMVNPQGLLDKKEICNMEWAWNDQQLTHHLAKKGASSKKLPYALQGCWCI